jgi:ElaB/YqjD/DUF883 family membrane-anchored ribosome-binding protein
MSTEVNNDKIAADLKAIVRDTEILLKDTSEVLGEKAADARKKLQTGLQVARQRLEDAQKVVVEKAKQTAKATDEFVHEHPWQAVGIAAGVGFLVGFLIRRK